MSDWGFGVVATSGSPEARQRLRELCVSASERAGVRLVPFIARTSSEIVQAIEDQEVGLAWLPPLAAIDAEERGLASPLVIPFRAQKTRYHAALIVRRGGPRTLAELQGRRVAWVAKDSAAGYLVPRMFLAAHGIELEGFFGREAFHESHEKVVDAVVAGDADVGATFCGEVSGNEPLRAPWLDAQGRATRNIETLATMGPIPNDAIVGSSALPPFARTAILRWLLSLDEAERARFVPILGTDAFRVPAPDHFTSLAHTVRAARARGLPVTTAALPAGSEMKIRIAR